MFPRFYAIADHDVARAHGWTLPALARACLQGGARLLQVRAKSLAARALLEVCEEVAPAAAATGATLVVNDRADVARLVAGAGVHVGQDDLPPALARMVVGPDAMVGLSTHIIAQIDAGVREPIGYLAVGPVFGTITKETGYEAVGLDLVRYASAAVGRAFVLRQAQHEREGTVRPAAIDSGNSVRPEPVEGRTEAIPVVAIGGVTLDRARSVVDAGASAVAVISDLFATGDPAARVAEFVRLLG